jgi:ribose/xylose/arabinose/galactoside ABC-type transport system permease subunit
VDPAPGRSVDAKQEAGAMAYDDSRFRGEPGFREEPDFRSDGGDATTLADQSSTVYAAGNYPVGGFGAGDGETTEDTVGRRGGGIDDLLDGGEADRDRVAVHVLWELLLLLGFAAVGYLLYGTHRAALSGTALRDLMLGAAVLGFLTLGMGLSLRGAAPNLAVGPIALASAVFFAAHADRGTLTTAVVTGLLALAVGAAVAVFVVGLHVPGWAASLAAGLAVTAWLLQQGDEVKLTGGAPQRHNALYWLAAVVALAVVGGLLGAVRPVRRSLGRFRPAGDPARRRGGAAALFTGLAILGSAALASAAGVLTALRDTTVDPSENGFALTGLALGVALIGGTSAYGRRGGVFGSILAVGLVTVVLRYVQESHRSVSPLLVAAGAIGLGLVVTRLVETFGRPKDADENDEWQPAPSTAPVASTTSGWTSRTTAGWGGGSAGSAATERWSAATGDDRWGSR